MKYAVLVLFVWCKSPVFSQVQDMENYPYYEIPEAPAEMNGATILARAIDGLGFRYYWASHELRPEDLAYDPGNGGQTAESVLKHIYGLSKAILNAASGVPNVRKVEKELDWEYLRLQTLVNLKEASDILKKLNSDDLSEVNVVFQRGDAQSVFPVWNLINGQLADAIYHTGQITSYRRSSGNPIQSGVSVFTGKVKQN